MSQKLQIRQIHWQDLSKKKKKNIELDNKVLWMRGLERTG
jgi:hypothetical protein